MPVARVHGVVKKKAAAKRVSALASIIATSGLETVLRRIVNNVAAFAKESDEKKRIVVSDIVRATGHDSDLRCIFANYSFLSPMHVGKPGMTILSKRMKDLRKSQKEERQAKKSQKSDKEVSASEE